MHAGPMDELIKVHIEERHREAARYRIGRPRNSSRRPRWLAARFSTNQSKRPREQCVHA
jgi:hypothetical protein